MSFAVAPVDPLPGPLPSPYSGRHKVFGRLAFLYNASLEARVSRPASLSITATFPALSPPPLAVGIET